MADPIYYGEALVNNIPIYETANTRYPIRNEYLLKGARVTIYDQYINGVQVWVRHNRGWSIASSTESGQSIKIQFLTETDKNTLYNLSDNSSSNDTTTSTRTTTNENLTSLLSSETTTDFNPSNKTMRLFGSPFQFSEYTDHRMRSVSDFFGKKYAERVVAHAPYITIIPGDADYLGGESKTKKEEDSGIILGRVFNHNNGGEDSGDENTISFEDAANNTEQTRYYNFRQNYIGYINRVNLTLRTMAIMLGLGDIALPVYNWDDNAKGASVTNVALKEYNWADYRWDATSYNLLDNIHAATLGDSIGEAMKDYAAEAGKSALARVSESNIVFSRIFGWIAGSSGGEETLEDSKLSQVAETRNYVQFYTDPTATDATDSIGNQTQESKLKSIFDSQQTNIKEMAFIAHTSGIDTSSFSEATSKALDAAMSTFADANGTGLKGILGRVTQAAGNVISGENVIFPEVYQYSTRDSSSRQFRINLYSPYGTPLAIYLNILVPIGFLICLTAPSNKSANSYEAPPLVKVFYDGVYSCSLGIIESLRISRDAADWTAEGLPTSAVVDMTVKDLYSDLSVNSAAEDVELFMHNSSLIEFLFTQCGLSMISYNYRIKAQIRWNTDANYADDKFSTIAGSISNSILNGIINKFKGII